ncbi:hypothetical protein DBR32_03970 [Taibaiella sp. KBW10]|uniref:hypothetical protein n=1 Tax=Taibaiella sp. KBW10 TaxID=2153357 RepID=UPI000F59ED4E|nr:hypothetical protein [Taibaiella sp. KBW10]RQO31969.1 hypothetical protein DBR32_03970 [Taibaiella sp. KBW10]
MPLVDFQQAFADLVADPALCRAIKKTPELMNERYALTDIEQERLLDILNQRGMVTNCMLYQINRFTPLFDLMPYSCKMLSKEIKQHTRAFWDDYIKTNFQFRDEVLLFASFLLQKVKEGKLDHLPHLHDVLNFEMTYNSIRFDVFESTEQNVAIYHPVLDEKTRLLYANYELRDLIDEVIQNEPGHVIEADKIRKVNSFYLIQYIDRIDMVMIPETLVQDILAGRVSEEDKAYHAGYFKRP